VRVHASCGGNFDFPEAALVPQTGASAGRGPAGGKENQRFRNGNGLDVRKIVPGKKCLNFLLFTRVPSNAWNNSTDNGSAKAINGRQFRQGNRADEESDRASTLPASGSKSDPC
jgi:hypothetical protein